MESELSAEESDELRALVYGAFEVPEGFIYDPRKEQ